MRASPKDAAVAFARNGQWLQAAETLAPHLLENPTDGDEFFLFGVALMKLGRPADAERLFLDADRLLPRSPAVLWNLARAHLEGGNIEASIDAYRRHMEAEPPAPTGAAGAAYRSPYTRKAPGPRYRELLDLYRGMHQDGLYTGLAGLVPMIPFLSDFLSPDTFATMLDYGGGRGDQYWAVPFINRWLPVDDVVVFDPGSGVGERQPADVVVCLDVLEHVDRLDVPWVVEDLFALARQRLFCNIAGYPAAKALPNGENAHCTLEPAEWWAAIFRDAAARHPNVRYRCVYTGRGDGSGRSVFGG